MKEFFLFIANLLLVVTIVAYLRNIVANGVTPNPATFFIRSVVAIMNCFSYFAVVNKDFFVLSVTIISAIGLTVVFSYSLFKGKFTKLRFVDIVCGTAAVIIGIIWKSTGSPVLANLLLQIIMLLSFYPAISGVITNHAKEKPMPWIFATLCYVFMIGAIITDWNAGAWYALVHPIVSGVVGNGSLAFAIIYAKAEKN